MTARIHVSEHSDVPIYRQIVGQVTFMIELGQLRDGDRLPGSRMLADNLGINRNTVARAYGELRAAGLIEPRGRNGMIVVGGERARTSSATRDQAREILERAARECLELGLSPAEVRELVTGIAIRVVDAKPTVAFVECNPDRARAFADEIARELELPVTPLVLGEFDPQEIDVDLVLTTFFHLTEVRSLLRGPTTDVVGLVVAPHVRTLVEIAQVPRGQHVGLWYHNDEQAASVRDSLDQAGLTDIVMLADTTDASLQGIDVVVIPSGMAQLRDRLAPQVRVIEFGNVLDAASLRMVRQVVDDLRLAKAGR
ncbi:GntR family transcriptional regulator [Rhodococcus rhodnii]|uniref:HTH gntR-type domain-containing protein n=2 Tax=Rhodococcus rhodnii TaxID=38312 RepID=R7WML3_9NOCA|nr:GntR family transcriptional regulator [Rhodococcus rhodnii]EOM76547.1 hypothetical protein Rrhod_2087 [Rhodococcus rhodnii LMG 5362]TXG92161.1 GntR family transcriptional regulator [Rhodococcus rhodnii]